MINSARTDAEGELIIGHLINTVTEAEYGAAAKWKADFLMDEKDIRRGVFALYSRDGSPISKHVRLVLERKEDDSYLAVEGNSGSDGGRVKTRPRKLEWTAAILRPQYGCTGKDI